MLMRGFTIDLPLYSAESAWNQRAADVSLDANNDARVQATMKMLTESSNRAGRDFNKVFVNSEEFSIPIFGARKQAVQLRTYHDEVWATHDPRSQLVGGELFIEDLPVPEGPLRPAGPVNLDSDGHLVLYDRDSPVEVDFFQATTQRDSGGQSLGGGRVGRTIHAAGFVSRFATDGLGAQLAAPGKVLNSARATGVPLLAGLLLPEDLQAIVPDAFASQQIPVIPHALAFALPAMRCLNNDCATRNATDWIYPASKSETRNAVNDPLALAAGERIRLSKNLFFADGTPVVEDDPQVAPITKIFFRTLREYGAYLIDCSGGVTFYAEDIHTASLHLPKVELEWLLGKRPADHETPWQAIVNVLNDQLSFQLANISGAGNQALPLVISDSVARGNVEVIAAATPPALPT